MHRPISAHRRARAHGRWPVLVAFLLAAVIAVLSFNLAYLLTSSAAAPRDLSVTGAVSTDVGTGATDPVARPHAAAATATHPPTGSKAGIPETVSIRIHPGDTLWGFARSRHTTVRELQCLNRLGASTLIYAGATLLVPAAGGAPPVDASTSSHVPTGGAAATPTSRGAAGAVAFARRQIGVPYVYGGTGAGGYDCSGLVQAAWRSVGVRLPRTTYQQVDAGTRISRGQLRPGDLVFVNDDGHVEMYVGGGMDIEAPHPGAYVRYTPLPPPEQVDAYVRVDA